MTKESRTLAALQNAYLSFVGLGGIVVTVLLVPPAVAFGDWGLLVFVGMGILSEWAHVPLARGAMSLSFAAVLPAFAAYGTGGAVLTLVAGYLLGHAAYDSRSWRVKLFNFGQYALTCAAAGLVYHLATALPGTGLTPGGLGALLLFTVVYFGVNHLLVGLWFTLVCPEESLSVIWGEPAKWEAMTYFITAPLGITVVMLYSSRGLIWALTLFGVSLAAAFVFRLAFKLDRLNHELRLLQESAQELTQGLELDPVRARIMSLFARLAPHDILALFEWDGDSHALRCVYSQPEDSVYSSRTLSLDEGAIGRVASGRRVEIVESPSVPTRPDAEGPAHPPALLIAPLVAENDLVGVLVMGSGHRGTYSEDHTRLLTIFAAQAAAALRRANRYHETRRMAITDSKTGVYNYRFFYELLLDEVRRHETWDKPFSLIFLDVDHLKEINDTYGHQVGDSVLKQVAAIIGGSIRESDNVARYGGEEFVVLLPGAVGEVSLAVAERIRASVEKHDFGEGGPLNPVKVTITAGVATYPEHATEPDELIFRADEAMYLGKSHGRNRVSLYSGPAPVAQPSPA